MFLPHFGMARKVFGSAPFFHPMRFLFTPVPPLLDELPAEEIARINRNSERYFDRPELKEFWQNKPFSDPDSAGWNLARFGQLILGLGIRRGTRILDFGCGTGWTSIMLAQMGAEVVGMDIAVKALEIARETASQTLSGEALDRLRFEAYSGNQIPCADQYFDTILVFEALHHLPNPRALFSEFHRVLAPNGWLGFAEPGVGHMESAASQMEMESGVLEQDLDLERLHRTGRAAGFQGLELFLPMVDASSFSLPMTQARWYLRGIGRLAPSYLHRAYLLVAPIGIFWKGPYFLSSLHPRHLRARIRPLTKQVACGAGETFQIHAQVRNQTDTVWLKEGCRGTGYVRLGAHLLDCHQVIQNLDYGRSDLARNLRRKEEERLTLNLKAPETPGEYTVRLDMVNEGKCWFEKQGSRTADVPLHVR